MEAVSFTRALRIQYVAYFSLQIIFPGKSEGVCFALLSPVYRTISFVSFFLSYIVLSKTLIFFAALKTPHCSTNQICLETLIFVKSREWEMNSSQNQNLLP